MTLNDAMKHLQPLADLAASRVHQKSILGSINGLAEIERTGQLDYAEKLIIRINDHCEQFSNWNASSCVLGASSASISQP